MRVVGGRFKGRVLSAFKGMSIRPTSDKVREAVFNILQNYPGLETVLDLFAGTGALGIEALSRGAGRAVFVESDPAALSVTRKNIDACGATDASRVIKRHAVTAIGELSRAGERFDLIFIDPPYGKGLIEESLSSIDRFGLLNAGGVIVAETSKKSPIVGLERLETIAVTDERRYGDTLVYFLCRKEDMDV